MINSMTGYGRATHEGEDFSCQVEIKSVNNRALKTSIRLPEGFAYCEVELENLVRSQVERGSITLNVTLATAASTQAADVNQEVLAQYIASLATASERCEKQSIEFTIDLAHLLSLPGACQNRSISSQEELACRQSVMAVAAEAMTQMLQMRRHEGEVLGNDLRKHLDEIRAATENIRQQAPAVSKVYHERLKARVNQLVSDAKMSLSDSDLLREVALFSDRSDISEEISRLIGHLDHFAEVAAQANQVGRTLEFIAQEMLREANTMGSKCSDGQITRWTVQIKGCIDRIKEQVQNVE